MTGIIKKSLISTSLILLLGICFTSKASAISNISDTLTTSRPSAAAPLDANQASTDSYVIVKDINQLSNSALWLASDSAFLFPDTGQSGSTVRVASMSGANTPSTNQRTVYFTSTVGAAHHNGTTMITPVTATHSIKFTAGAAISSGQKIQIVFPGAGSNSASPSATGFAFNNVSATPTDTTCYNVTGASVCGGTIASNQLNTYTFTITNTITGGQQVIINIGCTSQSSGICTGSAPRLVNPTKGVMAAGTADQWSINVNIQDSGGNNIETGKTIAATVESVQVQGIVEPYITFTIAGINNGTVINTNNAGCTGNNETTNTGIASSATFVNLGSIGAGFSIAAQDLSVMTNATNGYTITATSSGRFINPATGFWFADANGGNGLTAIDTPAPAVVAAGTTSFGIHPCGADTYTGVTWGTGTTGTTARYSNPWNGTGGAYYANLASYAGLPPSARKTTVEYEATAATTVPAGTYTTALTYVATPIF